MDKDLNCKKCGKDFENNIHHDPFNKDLHEFE